MKDGATVHYTKLDANLHSYQDTVKKTSMWLLKFLVVGIPAGMAYYIQNEAGEVPPQWLWAVVSAATNTIGATEYGGNEVLSYITVPFNLTYSFHLQRIQTGWSATIKASGQTVCKALPNLILRAIITLCAIGAGTMAYSGLYDGLYKTQREYATFWIVTNFLQYIGYIAMISADANQIASWLLAHCMPDRKAEQITQDLLEGAMANLKRSLFIGNQTEIRYYANQLTNLYTSNRVAYINSLASCRSTLPPSPILITTSKWLGLKFTEDNQNAFMRLTWLDVVCSGLSIVTMLGMLWSFNSMIMLIAQRPQLGFGIFGDILGLWPVAMSMNLITNGPFSYLNTRAGIRIMLHDFPLKMLNTWRNAADKPNEMWKRTFVVVGSLLLYGWVVSSIFTSVYYALSGTSSIVRPNRLTLMSFYQWTLIPAIIRLSTILTAIEAFGMNARPIVERAWKLINAYRNFSAAYWAIEDSEYQAIASPKAGSNHHDSASAELTFAKAKIKQALMLLGAAQQGEAEYAEIQPGCSV